MSLAIDKLTEEPAITSHPIPDPALPLNLYDCDRHLQLALARYYRQTSQDWAWINTLLAGWGQVCSQQIEPLVAEADRHGPTLQHFDRRGERVDQLVFHPAYHAIGQLVYGHGLAAMSNVAGFQSQIEPVSQLVKCAMFYQYCQVEGSISCPVSMTDILARVLKRYASPELIERYLPRLTSLDYSQLYTGAMFMTEKTGGSDVGATTTRAHRAADGTWRLNGDKWFCSNVGADLILTLARPENAPSGTRGLGLFLVPGRLPDSDLPNSYLINRLKDKLGTRAMASGEVTFQDTFAYLIEPLERGFVMMMEMVNGTRLLSGVGGAGALRRSVIEATLHARSRQSFGQPLARQPLLAEQLADLVVDSQATTSLVLAAAAHLDRADRSGSGEQKVLSRLLITLSKRYGTSHGVKGAQTAMEIRGGNGYIEDWPNARLLRDAYVQIIWEGGINMVSFDVLRTIERENAWPVFAAAIEQELSEMPALETATLAAAIRASLVELGRLVTRLMSRERAIQEIAAPQLAETMAGIYAGAVLCAEAAFEFSQPQPAGQKGMGLAAAQRYYSRFVQPLLATLAQLIDEHYGVAAIHEEASTLIDQAV